MIPSFVDLTQEMNIGYNWLNDFKRITPIVQAYCLQNWGKIWTTFEVLKSLNFINIKFRFFKLNPLARDWNIDVQPYICFTINRWIHSWTPAYHHITILQYHNMPSTFATSKCRAWLILLWVHMTAGWPSLMHQLSILQISPSPAIEPTTDPDTVANWLNDFKRITAIV